MKRVSLFITDKQDERLKALSLKEDVSAAELHRKALDELLKGDALDRIAELERKVAELEELSDWLESIEKRWTSRFEQRIAALEEKSHTHE